jgi:hypothetical protein
VASNKLLTIFRSTFWIGIKTCSSITFWYEILFPLLYDFKNLQGVKKNSIFEQKFDFEQKIQFLSKN